MKDTGIGIGALVRSHDARYYDAQDNYRYPGEEGYIAPVGLIMGNISSSISHYTALTAAAQHMTSDSFIQMQTIGSASLPDYRRTVGLTLPSIPGIVPEKGQDYYGRESARTDRLNHVDWEVVSPGQTEFDNFQWVTPKAIKKSVKEHFARDMQQEYSDFRTFPVSQRAQLRDYLDGIINLSQMTDPELPKKDS